MLFGRKVHPGGARRPKKIVGDVHGPYADSAI